MQLGDVACPAGAAEAVNYTVRQILAETALDGA
jgi:hypothetical protein